MTIVNEEYSSKNPKLDIFHKGEYVASTKFSPTNKHAKQGWLDKHPDHKAEDIKVIKSVNEDYIPAKPITVSMLDAITSVMESKKKIGEYSHGSNSTKVYKLSGEHNEGDPFVVHLHKNGKHYEPADYFTNDLDDAHGTAKSMVKEDLDESKDTGYTTPFSGSASDRDAANVLIKKYPTMTKDGHASEAKAHSEHAEKAANAHDRLLDAAAQKTWGRKFHVLDYKISGIGSDEFSNEDKTNLRDLNKKINYHSDMHRAHDAASSSRKLKEDVELDEGKHDVSFGNVTIHPKNKNDISDHDVNGNPIVRYSVSGGRKKSIQVPYSFRSSHTHGSPSELNDEHPITKLVMSHIKEDLGESVESLDEESLHVVDKITHKILSTHPNRKEALAAASKLNGIVLVGANNYVPPTSSKIKEGVKSTEDDINCMSPKFIEEMNDFLNNELHDKSRHTFKEKFASKDDSIYESTDDHNDAINSLLKRAESGGIGLKVSHNGKHTHSIEFDNPRDGLKFTNLANGAASHLSKRVIGTKLKTLRTMHGNQKVEEA